MPQIPSLFRFPFLLMCAWTMFFASRSMAQSMEAGEVQGTILARSGDLLSIDCPPGELPAEGVRSDMFKHFEEKWGKSVMSGWLGTARVETVSITARPGGRILLKARILEEKSTITVNGEKVDHFKVGKLVKLKWPAEEVEDGTGAED